MEMVSLDTRDMERGIDAVLRSAETRSRAFFEGAKAGAKAELRRYQKEHRGPDGEPWPASRKGKRRLLGRVPTAYSWTAADDGLVGEHKIPWGAAHHDGAVVGHGARLPARPFAGFTESFSGEIRKAWLAWVGKGW